MKMAGIKEANDMLATYIAFDKFVLSNDNYFCSIREKGSDQMEYNTIVLELTERSPPLFIFYYELFSIYHWFQLPVCRYLLLTWY